MIALFALQAGPGGLFCKAGNLSLYQAKQPPRLGLEGKKGRRGGLTAPYNPLYQAARPQRNTQTTNSGRPLQPLAGLLGTL